MTAELFDVEYLNIRVRVGKRNSSFCCNLPKDWSKRIGLTGKGEEYIEFAAHSIIKNGKVIKLNQLYYKT